MGQQTETSSPPLEVVLDAYLAAWNEPDPAERAALLERSVTDDVLFVDPMIRAEGRAALEAHIADMRAKFPELTYEPSGDLDRHGPFIRQAWTVKKDGAFVLRGLDVDDIAPDGRLSRIIGFFDSER